MAIHKKYLISAPIEKVWQALVGPEIIKKWGAGPNVIMSDEEGSKFSLWNGDIFGKNIKMVKNKMLVQDWFGGDWKEPSKVTIALVEKDGKTEVTLTHINIPQSEEKSFDEGWDEYYFGPLIKLVEE